MAFKTLSIRIPEEAHQKLEKLAEERQQKVSDVARELIVNGLKGGTPADNALVIEYLEGFGNVLAGIHNDCLLYTSPSPRDQRGSRMPSSA